MKLRIPFAYHALYTYRGHRRVEKAVLLAEITVDLEEVARPAAPAYEIGSAVRLEDKALFWTRFRLIGGRPCRVWRLEGDGLFVEYCAIGVFNKRIKSWRDNPFNAEDHDGSALPFGQFLQEAEATSYEALSAEMALRFWSDDGGRAKGELIARRASAFRVIDGMVCVSVGEPVLVVSSAYKRIDLVVTEDVRDRRNGLVPSTDFWSGKRFPLDQFADAKDFAKSAARETGDPLRIRVSMGKGNTAPAFLPWESEHVVYQAWSILMELRNMRKTSGIETAREGLEAACLACPSDHVTESLIMAIGAVVNTLGTTPPDLRQEGSEVNGRLSWKITQIENDIAAWRARLPSPAEWPETALPIPASWPDGISQIMTLLSLKKAAIWLEAPLQVLENERSRGNLLLWVPESSYRKRCRSAVAVVSQGMALVGWIGYRGLPVPANDPERVEAFLTKNRHRIEEQALLADLEF